MPRWARAAAVSFIVSICVAMPAIAAQPSGRITLARGLDTIPAIERVWLSLDPYGDDFESYDALIGAHEVSVRLGYEFATLERPRRARFTIIGRSGHPSFFYVQEPDPGRPITTVYLQSDDYTSSVYGPYTNTRTYIDNQHAVPAIRAPDHEALLYQVDLAPDTPHLVSVSQKIAVRSAPYRIALGVPIPLFTWSRSFLIDARSLADLSHDVEFSIYMEGWRDRDIQMRGGEAIERIDAMSNRRTWSARPDMIAMEARPRFGSAIVPRMISALIGISLAHLIALMALVSTRWRRANGTRRDLQGWAVLLVGALASAVLGAALLPAALRAFNAASGSSEPLVTTSSSIATSATLGVLIFVVCAWWAQRAPRGDERAAPRDDLGQIAIKQLAFDHARLESWGRLALLLGLCGAAGVLCDVGFDLAYAATSGYSAPLRELESSGFFLLGALMLLISLVIGAGRFFFAATHVTKTRSAMQRVRRYRRAEPVAGGVSEVSAGPQAGGISAVDDERD